MHLIVLREVELVLIFRFLLVLEFVCDLLRSYKAETTNSETKTLKQGKTKGSTRVQTLKRVQVASVLHHFSSISHTADQQTVGLIKSQIWNSPYISEKQVLA